MNIAFINFFYRDRDWADLKKKKKEKKWKLSTPLMEMLIQWAAFLIPFFIFINIFSFTDYNRFLTSLRSDEPIKLGNWSLYSSHNQLEISFSATNENQDIESIFYTALQTSLIVWDSCNHLYNLATGSYILR